MYKGEDQYKDFQRRLEKSGTAKLGLMTSFMFEDDPTKLIFPFARYTFAAKMLAGC